MDVDGKLKKEDSDDSLDAVMRPFDVVSPWNKAHFVETQPFQRKLFKEFAAHVYENHKINIDADVVDDILETTCGHPGFSIWMLIKSIQQAIGHGFLTTAEWMNSKRSIYNTELYKTSLKKSGRYSGISTVWDEVLNRHRIHRDYFGSETDRIKVLDTSCPKFSS